MKLQNPLKRLCGDPMLYKNTFKKIRKSFGRYISLFIIVLVGVGVFAGIQSTAPDIRMLANQYYKDYNLTDFKIVSSMGLNEDDVVALKHVKYVNSATGSYSLDALESGKPIRIHSIEDNVNQVKLISGEMPENIYECLADSKNYNIGDKVSITSDVSDKLSATELTVTGLIDSVLYLSEDYGSSTVGDGKLSSYIFVDNNLFTMDIYTEIYVTMEGSKEYPAYSDEYKSLSKALNDELVKIKADRENARYESIYNEANDKITVNETKLNKEKADGEKKLADAKKELDENLSKIEEGEEELASNEKTLADNIQKQNKEFDEAKSKIAAGWKEINAALSQGGIKKEDLGAKVTELELAIQNMKTQLSSLPEDSQEYEQLSATVQQYTIQQEGLKKLKESVDLLEENESSLAKGIQTYNTEIEKAKTEIEKGKTELEENEKKINDGYDEYNENLNSFNDEISDAETKIADAKQELSEMEHPKWHILDRETAVGYEGLEADIDVVASVAKVFPVFFILIAMLMTSNSMSRMIAEERSELGTLTSLGYKDRKIISTYLLYVLSASVAGVLAGYFLGCGMFPKLIYSNFDYILPTIVMYYDWRVLGIILGVTIVLMSVVTITACNQELKEKPATLLRPVPPKKGQKILLERVDIIWKNLSFTWKVTMRNIFRYKKRALMTIVGVAGCTALLLVGFGLRGSMDGIADKQFEDIFRYDNMIVLKDEISNISGELEEILQKEQIVDPLLLKQAAIKSEQEETVLDTFLIVPKNMDMFSTYYHLTSKMDQEPVSITEDGVIISEKIAETFEIGKGDTLTIKDADNNTYLLTVSNVVENYISNYVYMSSELYEKTFGQEIMYNALVSDFSGNEQILAKNLIDSGLVVNITFTNDIMQTVLDGNAKLNSIIILLIAVASILAFIVLYNLTAINISERKREIATLKVLGFRDGETNSYIYREALILTLVSIVIGLLLGIVLHHFVITVIEGTSRVLFKKIAWSSYGISGALTMIFSLIMQLITYYKLKTIDMVESLKSVE